MLGNIVVTILAIIAAILSLGMTVQKNASKFDKVLGYIMCLIYLFVIYLSWR